MTECKNKIILIGNFSHPLNPYSNIFDKKYRVTSGFGMRSHPNSGEQLLHKGIDYAAPSNSPVYATFSGKVSRVSWDLRDKNHGYGNWVEIEHPLGNNQSIYTRYGHLGVSKEDPRINVKVGDSVVKGQEIAKSGKTGGSTGYHLHYEVRKGISGRRNTPSTEEIFDPLNDVRYNPDLSELQLTNYENYVRNYIDYQKQQMPEEVINYTMSDQGITELANKIDEANKSMVSQLIKDHTSYNPVSSCFNPNSRSEELKEQFKRDLIRVRQNILSDIIKFKIELDQLQEEALNSCIDLNHFEEMASTKTLDQPKFSHQFTLAKEAMSHRLDQHLSQLRQQCSGIKFYIWRTKNDDKVRPSHQERNGKLFAYGNNDERPGDAYGCRCIAEPSNDKTI